jgi:ubiquinone/menaquinone biosynthesis C-methylase UbiE
MEHIYMAGHICPYWFAYMFDNPLRVLFHHPQKIFGSYVKEGMTVLDVGCGMGFFSIGLAKLVGKTGSVIAADIQEKMLTAVKRRAEKAGVSGRIRIHRCAPDNLGIDTPVDFILTFWMVHEVADINLFFRQISSCLKPHGKIFVVEPRFHVSSRRFQDILLSARQNGLEEYGTAPVHFSRSAILSKD